MARKPFFSGDYGSALAQIDTRPIMQGAAAQAAAYQGIGQNIAGAIEKYQLNKEKREKNEAAAIGTISGMPPQMLQALSANPETAKLMERIQGANASPKDFDKFNAMSAAYTVAQKSNLEQENARAKNDALRSQTVITDLQGKFDQLTQEERARKVKLGNAATELAMEQVQVEKDLAKAKGERDKDEAKVRLKHLSEQVRGLKLAGDFTDLTWEDRLSEARSKAELAEEEVEYKKAQKGLTEQTALLKKAEAFTEKNKKKYNPGDKVDIDGKPFYWDGSKVVPLGVELTPSEQTTAALKLFGGEPLLAYYDLTRDEKGDRKTKGFWTDELVELDDFKEGLLVKVGMKLNDPNKSAPQSTGGTTSGTAGGIGYQIVK
tara:strand:- start:348 stop:1475 length:1128 start_codon:yes stop_codon:yes gene_type:complete